MTKPMIEEERWRRLRALNDAMVAKRRLDPPPESEADEWHRLRFDFDEHSD